MVQWDPFKAAENTRKHGIEFEEALAVVDHPYSVGVANDHSGEDRFAVIGPDGLGRVLFVIYTWRGDELRLISARRATQAERRKYEAGRR